VAGAEQRNARLTNAVLANGSDSRVVVAEREFTRCHVARCDDSDTLASMWSVLADV